MAHGLTPQQRKEHLAGALDPYDLTIDASAAATISTDLASSNITVQTSGSAARVVQAQQIRGNGDIFVDANISWISANDLTLSAYRNIEIANGVKIANSTSDQPVGNIDLPLLVLRADNTGTGVGTVIFDGTSMIDFSRVDVQVASRTWIFSIIPLAATRIRTNFFIAYCWHLVRISRISTAPTC